MIDVEECGPDVTERVSLPGVYRGYSGPIADGYTKVALYLPVRDGCRLALDIYRPTRSGAFLGDALPTVLVSTGYRRSFLLKPAERYRDQYFPQYEYGDCVSWVTRAARLIDRHVAQWLEPIGEWGPGQFREWLLEKASVYEFLMMHGYNVAILDNRATGASFGRADQLDHQQQGEDISDILDWIAEQSWSTANLGMTGASWLGLAQNAAVSCNPRHLKAVMPIVAGEDTFPPMYPGGLYNVGLMRQWYAYRDLNERGYQADVVDEDPDGTLFRAAIAERDIPVEDPHWVLDIPTPDQLEAQLDRNAQWSRDRYGENSRYYDRLLPDGRRGDWKMSHLDPTLANQTSIAYYGYGGFWDLCGYTQAMAFADLTIPRKMVLGPWHHSNWMRSEIMETLRWMDYHLKGIDNGIMAEPPVTYATSHPEQSVKWYAADRFPPSGMSWLTLHGSADPADNRRGSLSQAQPADASFLSFTVDYATTSGLENRQWGYALGPLLSIGKLEGFRDEILSFLTDPFAADLEITGYPVLKFTMTTSGTEGGIFAYLQDVAPDGTAHYISEAQLNLRDRKVSEPPFDYLGLPYHSILEKDRLSVIPGEPMIIEIGLCQTSWTVPAGHRLLLTIAGADKDNFHLRPLSPEPQITVHCGGETPFTLDLPVLGAGKPRGVQRIDSAFENLPEWSRKTIEPSRIGGRLYDAVFRKN